MLLSDQAYADIVFDEMKFLSALELSNVADQVICCSSFSRTYSITEWGLG
ncbi:aminotransferase class I/II-fold pyridoxal phosphate-dependent enzyme [Arthrobacter rhizosphaerae]